MPSVPPRLRAIVFRLEPTRRQAELCGKTAGCARFVFNWGLALREEVWLSAKAAGAEGLAEPFGYTALANLLPSLKEEHPWLAEVPSHTLQQALRDLDRAFVNFFEGRAGFPKYRRRGAGTGFRFPDPKQIKINGRAMFLPKLGWVKYRRSVDRLPGAIRSITVKKDGEHWVASVLFAERVAPVAASGGPAVGFDAGVANSATLSTGAKFHLPVATEKETQRARRLARVVSRRRVGSANRAKAQARLNRFQGHILHRVSDARHKFTTALAKNHGLIAAEDLRLASMTASARGTVEEPGSRVRQKAGLNKALLSQGIGESMRQLAYKCQWYGSRLVLVNAAHTSQTCSCCGHVHPDNRVTRDTFLCQKCGHTECADTNAAKTILARGLAAPAEGYPAAACGGVRKTIRRSRRPAAPAKQEPARQNQPRMGRLTRGIPVKTALVA